MTNPDDGAPTSSDSSIDAVLHALDRSLTKLRRRARDVIQLGREREQLLAAIEGRSVATIADESTAAIHGESGAFDLSDETPNFDPGDIAPLERRNSGGTRTTPPVDVDDVTQTAEPAAEDESYPEDQSHLAEEAPSTDESASMPDDVTDVVPDDVPEDAVDDLTTVAEPVDEDYDDETTEPESIYDDGFDETSDTESAFDTDDAPAHDEAAAAHEADVHVAEPHEADEFAPETTADIHGVDGDDDAWTSPELEWEDDATDEDDGLTEVDVHYEIDDESPETYDDGESHEDEAAASESDVVSDSWEDADEDEDDAAVTDSWEDDQEDDAWDTEASAEDDENSTEDDVWDTEASAEDDENSTEDDEDDAPTWDASPAAEWEDDSDDESPFAAEFEEHIEDLGGSLQASPFDLDAPPTPQSYRPRSMQGRHPTDGDEQHDGAEADAAAPIDEAPARTQEDMAAAWDDFAGPEAEPQPVSTGSRLRDLVAQAKDAERERAATPGSSFDLVDDGAAQSRYDKNSAKLPTVGISSEELSSSVASLRSNFVAADRKSDKSDRAAKGSGDDVDGLSMSKREAKKVAKDEARAEKDAAKAAKAAAKRNKKKR